MGLRSLGRVWAIWVLCSCFAFAQSRPFLALFGSEECEDCVAFKTEYQETMTEPEDPVMVYVCIDGDAEYLFLKQLEKELHAENTQSLFPVLFAGRHFLYGVEEIRDNFEEILEWCQDSTTPVLLLPLQDVAAATEGNFVAWTVPPEDEILANPTSQTKKQHHLLYLETSANCRHCERQGKELALLQQSMPGVVITQLEVTTQEGQLLYQRFLKHFEIAESSENLAPLVAWEEGFVAQRLATSEELIQALQAQDAETSTTERTVFWEGPPTEEELAALDKRQGDFLSKTTLLTTILAGLLDGINPCAFATVIFLISYLLYLKRGRRFVLAVGLCFCTGVFLSYLLFGVGLSFLVDFLNRFNIVKTILYGLFVVAGVVLFALHLRDALRFRRSGNVSQMEMGLDAQAHRKIHDKIHRWGKVTSAMALPAAVILGCVVSSMEFVCTGQIYLPMLMAINAQGFNPRAFLSLLIYNLAFILPLITVSILAYYGVGAQALAKWAREHVFVTKVLMAVLFLLLALLMLGMLLAS